MWFFFAFIRFKSLKSSDFSLQSSVGQLLASPCLRENDSVPYSSRFTPHSPLQLRCKHRLTGSLAYRSPVSSLRHPPSAIRNPPSAIFPFSASQPFSFSPPCAASRNSASNVPAGSGSRFAKHAARAASPISFQRARLSQARSKASFK